MMWRRIFRITLVLLFIAMAIFVFVFIGQKKKNVLCQSVDIRLHYEDEHVLVTSHDVLKYLYQTVDTLTGKKMAEIDVAGVEDVLKSFPVISRADIYPNVNGVLEITAEQRSPIVRIVDKVNKSYYMDKAGALFPVSKQYSANVLIANGDLNFNNILKEMKESQEQKSEVLESIKKVSGFIVEDGFFKHQIEQIYWNTKGEIELVPKVGNHLILLGSEKNIAEKMKNLKVFYQKGISAVGWDTYKTINLKYSGQIVCEKIKK